LLWFLIYILENFTRKVGSLNGEVIEAKLLASNFAVDAFTTAAFSMSMTADEPIANFDKVPFVKAMIDFLTPSAAILIPLLIPYGQVDMVPANWLVDFNDIISLICQNH